MITFLDSLRQAGWFDLFESDIQALLIFDPLITLWGNFDAPYLKLLNDASVASACFYVRTCRRVRNSKKIATIRDFHLPGSFLCLSTRLIPQLSPIGLHDSSNAYALFSVGGGKHVFDSLVSDFERICGWGVCNCACLQYQKWFAEQKAGFLIWYSWVFFFVYSSITQFFHMELINVLLSFIYISQGSKMMILTAL